MASPPVTAPSQNNNNNNSLPSSSKNSSSEAHPPSSSPKTQSSPPPASPPPPAKKSPAPPPPKTSSPPPPPTSPSPKNSSPPPQKQNSPSPSPPPPSQPNSNSQEPKSNPPPPPAPTNTPSTPNSPSSETFIPPPPATAGEKLPPGPPGKLGPPQAPRSEAPNKSPSGSSSSGGNDRSPARSGGSSSSSSTSTSTSHSTTIAIVAGVGVAVGVLIVALAVLCVVCTRRKKRKHYYMDPGVGPPPGNEYYTPGTAQWNSPPDHVVKLTPPPGMTPGVPGGGGWHHQTPPPVAPPNTSKDFSGGTPPHVPLSPPGPNMALGFSKSQFTYEELATATGGFSKGNLLGQGGFGYVHKGVLPNGQEVGVKSLKTGSGQGEREFQAEVEIISRVHHRHLVSLVGYCIADGQRMLVYEFVPNKTMEFHLHGKNQPVMDWSTRLRIALGSAKGLGYLHEDCHPKIIHRDIKAANILLDNNFEAMVADFGLAKLSSDNYTHISTRVMGTFGYMAPEYASSGKLTDKSDVFSFGVMLLELITGRRPLDLSGKYMEEDSLVDWARPLLTKAIEEGEYKELVDPRLGDNYNPQEMACMVTCAAASIRHSARRRPKMSQIVRALDGDSSLDDLKDGKGGHGANNGNTETYDTNDYNADMMKFKKMVMMSQDFTSSEYGGTSDYGHPSSASSDSREMDSHYGNTRRKF